MAAAALVYALKNRTEGSKMVETMCEKCFSVLRNHLKYENHALLLSNLKVVSIFLRMNGNLLEKYASTLHEIVMNEILPLRSIRVGYLLSSILYHHHLFYP